MPDEFFVGIKRRFRRFSGAKSKKLSADNSKKDSGRWAGELIIGSVNEIQRMLRRMKYCGQGRNVK